MVNTIYSRLSIEDFLGLGFAALITIDLLIGHQLIQIADILKRVSRTASSRGLRLRWVRLPADEIEHVKCGRYGAIFIAVQLFVYLVECEELVKLSFI